MPSIPTLQDKTTIRAGSSDREKPPLRKYIKLLALCKTSERFKAIGGPWNPELDGQDPATNSQVLVNAAIRICKTQLGLDLSYCKHWHRFLEFRYSRTEGSTARPSSILFPGSQLWGRSFPETVGSKFATPSKPYHRIVVYFLPDIWSIMPSTNEWTNVKKAMENSFSRRLPQLFPIPQAELNAQSEETTAAIKSENTPNPLQDQGTVSDAVPSTARGDNPPSPSMKEPTNSAMKTDESTVSLDTGTLETNEASVQSPTSTGANIQEAPSHEEASLGKTPLKSHDEINLSAMKVSELREQLKVRDLPTDGIKAQLLSRLKTAIEKEAELARKEEEERKQKEMEMQVAQAAKEEEDKKQMLLKPTTETPAVPKPEVTVTLRNYPSIIIQQRLTDDYTLQTVSLDSILESKSEFMDARSYELIVVAHNFIDMLRRDSIFTLFRALVTAGDRGIQAKSQSSGDSVSDSKSIRSEHKDSAPGTHLEPVKLETIDLPLLCASTFLDTRGKGYFRADETEEMIVSLGLPVSRYQVRSLVTKVADAHRIHYRSLTDTEISPSAPRNISALSEIDDDEYLFELIRGGDAILDEQKELAMPTGSVFVLRAPTTEEPMESASSSVCPPTDELVAQQLSQLESECAKLKRQLKHKVDEIDRLRSMTDQIPSLKEKLNSANSSIDDLRRRLRGEYDRMHSAYRLIEQQLNNLESSRTALRQVANRLRGREDDGSTPSKKTASDQREGRREHSERKGTIEKNSSTPKPKEEVKETQEPDVKSVNVITEAQTENELEQKQTVSDSPMDVSVSVMPINSSMVNGLGDDINATATSLPNEIQNEEASTVPSE